MATRITEGVQRPSPIEMAVNGRMITTYPGESLAAALLANGIRSFRRTACGQMRGPFCNMGVCFECLVEVQNQGLVRACMTPATDGMRITLPGIQTDGSQEG